MGSLSAAWYGSELEDLGRGGLARSIKPLAGRDGKRVQLDGRWLFNLSSNDYLGLETEGELWREFCQSRLHADPGSRDFSPSASASRLMSGTLRTYDELECRLAAYFQKPAAVLFNSGYAANLGLLPALAGPGDVFFSDRMNHASLIDGMRLSGAAFFRYRHNDPQHLETLLKKERGKFRRAWILTESVFSMDGDRADLEAVVRLKNAHDALLYVDEAHAFGVLGENGRGWAEASGTLADCDLVVGTFGKAWASQGAFAVTEGLLRDLAVNKARSLIYSTALPPLTVAWNLFLVDRIPPMSAKRADLAALSRDFRAMLASAGLKTAGEGSIVPLVLGENRAALTAYETAVEAGFLAVAVRPPTVPEGTARLRCTLTAAMRASELAPFVSALSAAAGGVP